MVLTTAQDIATHLSISRESLRDIAEYLPIFGLGGKRHSYVTTTEYLDFINSRIADITNGDFDSIKSLVQSSQQHVLSAPGLYEKKSKQCITVAFNNLKGGVTKTTTVANIGAILAALNQKVLLVDMDMQNQLSTFFDEESAFSVDEDLDELSDEELDALCEILGQEKYESKSILNIIKDYADTKEVNYKLVDEIIQTVDFGIDGKTLDILPAEWRLGRGLETARSIANVSILLKKILKAAKEKYDFILIDTSPSNMLSIELSFFASDYITLVSTPDKKSYQSFRKILEELGQFQKDLEEFHYDIKLDSLIISKTVKSVKSQKALIKVHQHMSEKIGIGIYSVPQKEIFAAADIMGRPLISFHEKRTEALETIRGLGDYAINLINREG